MPERQLERHESAPGMPNDNGRFEPEAAHSSLHEIGLGSGRPGPRPRPFTMTKARPVEGHDPVPRRQLLDDAADLELLHHGAIAVQEKDRRLLAARVDIMEANSVDANKTPLRRVSAQGSPRAPLHINSARAENSPGSDK